MKSLTQRNLFIFIILTALILPLAVIAGSGNAPSCFPQDPAQVARIAKSDQNPVKRLFMEKNRIPSALIVTQTLGTGSISGTVSGLTPGDIGFAVVEAFIADSSAGAFYRGTAFVQADYTYQIDNLPAGDFYVYAYCPGYAPTFYDGASDMNQADLVAVEEGQTTEDIDFTLQPISSGKGQISGTVQDESNNAPIVGAQVYAVSSDFTSYGYGQANSQGNYKITGLNEGDYYVAANAWGYNEEYYNNATDYQNATLVPVTANQETQNINFTLKSISSGTGSISGDILEEGNNNPVANANVYCMSMNGFSFGQAQTDSQGHYHLDNLTADNYYVWADAVGFISEIYDNVYNWNDATPVTVQESTETAGIDFLLGKGGSLSGTVTDENDNPVAGAFISAYPTQWNLDSIYIYSPGHWGGYTTTDQNGYYTMSGLVSGYYKVLAVVYKNAIMNQEWYDDKTEFENADSVHVINGQETTGIDFKIEAPPDPGSISGNVTDAKGNPIQYAQIEVKTADPQNSHHHIVWQYASTDENGNYIVEDLPPGDYIVSCWAQSGWQWVQIWWPDADNPGDADPVTVYENQPTENINFQLSLEIGNASISGTVKNLDGTPLQFALILATTSQGHTTVYDSSSIWAYANSDSEGNYTIDHLHEGTYRIVCYYWENLQFAEQWYDHADSVADATPVVLQQGEARTGINFDLNLKDIYGTICGTVTDAATGQPITRGKIRIEHASSTSNVHYQSCWAYYTELDNNGNYKKTDLPEGDYLVSAFVDGGFAYHRSAIVPDMADIVTVVPGAESVADIAVDIRNEGTGAIAGTVTADFAYMPGDTSQGNPWGNAAGDAINMAVIIAKPAVTILSYPDSEKFFTTLSKADGSYLLTGLPDGDYFVMCFAEDYIPEFYDDVFDPSQATLVNVTQGVTTINIDFALYPIYGWNCLVGTSRQQSGSVVYGQVKNNYGNNLQGATVYLLDSNGDPVSYANTKLDGSYEIKGIAPNEYHLQVGKIGYNTQYNGNAGSLQQSTPIPIGNGDTQINFELTSSTTGVNDEKPVHLPGNIMLYRNYPNPFNPETTMEFYLPRDMKITLVVYNQLGQEIIRLIDGIMPTGSHTVKWEGNNHFGNKVASGIYIYRLHTSERVLTQKMVLLR